MSISAESGYRVSIAFQKSVLYHNCMNSAKIFRFDSLRFIPSASSNRFPRQASFLKAKKLIIIRNSSRFWSKFLQKTLIPHLLATIVTFILFFIKENMLVDLCWVDRPSCGSCPWVIKYTYLFVFISLEYIIPTSWQFFVIFSASGTTKLKNLIRIYFVGCYLIIYFWYMIWDFKVLILFDAPTPDFLIYCSLILSSLALLPLILRETKKRFREIKQRTCYNGFFMVYIASWVTLVSYLIDSVYEAFKDYDADYFQLFIFAFSILLEEINVWFCVKNYRYGFRDWKGSNLTVIVYSKSMFLIIYSFRIANFCFLNRKNFSFYIFIASFLALLIKILTGRSLLQSLQGCLLNFRAGRKKKLISKANKTHRKDAQCLKIIGYQKFDLMFSYIPRILSLAFSRTWTIAQPPADLIEGCHSAVKRELGLSYTNLYIFILVDVVFTFLVVILVWRKLLNLRFYYQVERVPFAAKVLLYVGNQLTFEYMLTYFLTMINLDKKNIRN